MTACGPDTGELLNSYANFELLVEAATAHPEVQRVLDQVEAAAADATAHTDQTSAVRLARIRRPEPLKGCGSPALSFSPDTPQGARRVIQGRL